MAGYHEEKRNENGSLTVPKRRLEEGGLCLLDGKTILTFRGIQGFFACVEGSRGMQFRVPASRVTGVRS